MMWTHSEEVEEEEDVWRRMENTGGNAVRRDSQRAYFPENKKNGLNKLDNIEFHDTIIIMFPTGVNSTNS